MVGNEICNAKNYLLDLKLDKMRLFVAIEKGGRKMSKGVMAIVFPKSKLADRKWISKVYRREVKAKDQIKYTTSFELYESPNKTEQKEDLEKNSDKRNERACRDENIQF